MSTRTPSIISTVLTVLALLATSAASILFTMVALNGFSDREGGPALLVSVLCNSGGVILAAIAAWRLPRWLIERFNWNRSVAIGISTLAGVVLGGGLSFAALFIGVLVGNTLWQAR